MEDKKWIETCFVFNVNKQLAVLPVQETLVCVAKKQILQIFRTN